jgi:SPP1 gp7 family putative phage head morphogenesis protein
VKSEQYWAKRMDDLNEAILAKGEEYIKKQAEEYGKSLTRIRRQTEAWYARLAKNNDISLAEARKLLDRNELREFHWTLDDYIKAGQENAVDQRWMKELENASAKVHITRLQELEIHLRNEIEQLAAKRLKGTTDSVGSIYKDSYYKSLYELQKGSGVGTSFAQLDDRQIDKVLAKPWAPDGSNFSARIWQDRTKLANELQTILTQDLIRGEPVDKVIDDFAKRMNVNRHAAERLIRTEAAYFSGQSRFDAYKEMGVERIKYVATLDLRTSDLCQGMDGKVIELNEVKAGVNYPPLHVYCRSTTIPYFDDADPGERAARNKEGDTYYVPDDMTYKDWAEKHAPKDVAEPPRTDEPKPISPQKVKTEPATPSMLDTPEKRHQAADDMVSGASKDLDDFYRSIVEQEPSVSAAVQEAVREAGGEMAGLDYRIKSKESWMRKVSTDLTDELQDAGDIKPIDVARKINDTLRYTAIAIEEKYYSVYALVMMSLINKGHAVEKVKNFWNAKHNPYKGVNITLVSPGGISYELQFHTPESYDLKQNKMHELYEEYRLPTTSKERKMELWKEMMKLADGIRKPQNIHRIT